ncbi:MAG: PDZ domain-containing protein [Acidobacteriota bacterium]
MRFSSPLRRPRPALRRSGLACSLLVALPLALAAGSTPAAAGEPCDVSCAPCVQETVDHLKTRGWVGVILDTDDEGRWVVTDVAGKSPAAGAGLRVGDVLLELEGIPYRKETYTQLKDVYDSMVPGREITYTTLRGGERLQISVTLAPLPEHVLASWLGYRILKGLKAQHGAPPAPPRGPAPRKRPPGTKPPR